MANLDPRDITQGESGRSASPLGGENQAATPSPIGSQVHPNAEEWAIWLASMEDVPRGNIDQNPSAYVLMLVRHVAALGSRVVELETRNGK